MLKPTHVWKKGLLLFQLGFRKELFLVQPQCNCDFGGLCGTGLLPRTSDTLIIRVSFCFSWRIETSGGFCCCFPEGWALLGFFFIFLCSLLVYVEFGAQGLCGVWQIKSCFAANYQSVEISEPIFSNVVIAYSSKSAREADLLYSSYCWQSLKGNHLKKKKRHFVNGCIL